MKITSTLKHAATVVEIFRSDPSKLSHLLPCTTAHSVNMAQLPHPGLVSRSSAEALALKAEFAERAFVIRWLDKDWAVLKGKFLSALRPSRRQ
jgi:hypothetical protein